MADPTKQPTFHPPSSAMDPTVASLLAQNDLVVQSGVRYCEYVKIRPKDGIELAQNSRLMNYHYKDSACFLNSRRMFLSLDFHCEKEGKAALVLDDFCSIATPLAHSLIDSVIVNLGESLLNR